VAKSFACPACQRCLRCGAIVIGKTCVCGADCSGPPVEFSGGGPPAVFACPACRRCLRCAAIIMAGACPCGAMGQPIATNGTTKPPPRARLSPQSPDELGPDESWALVESAEYYEVQSKQPGMPPAFGIRYQLTEGGTAQSAIWLGASRAARRVFQGIWKQRTTQPNLLVPETAREAVARSDELTVPGAVRVAQSGRFLNVRGALSHAPGNPSARRWT